jgi:hypothetical protein
VDVSDRYLNWLVLTSSLRITDRCRQGRGLDCVNLTIGRYSPPKFQRANKILGDNEPL